LATAKDLFRTRRARPGREIRLTGAGIAVTLVATALTSLEVGTLLVEGWTRGSAALVIEQLSFALIVAGLVYGNLDYQASRLAYFRRIRDHRPAPAPSLARFREAGPPPLTILVPSYKEELRVIEQTVLSAALQDYPERRVVLLIDDPPNPSTEKDRQALETTRRWITELHDELAKQAFYYTAARNSWRDRRERSDASKEWLRLGLLHLRVADWFEARAGVHPMRDHNDALFVEMVYEQRARLHATRSAELLSRPDTAGFDEAELDRAYDRLAELFRVEVTCFERKRHVNLSHEPNKAMNLNTYLSLLGHHLKETENAEGERLLVDCALEEASLTVPHTPFVITLDADSLLDPSYAIRLTHVMEQPGNEKLGVVQTPYSAVPGPDRVIERVAGATTDVQYIIDQGSERMGAAFWIGANALLRTAALDDIREADTERGYPIFRYIQDWTQIEDTESTVDLIDRGWRLHNYPERLSFSATPADYGSLLIQRRRWANGGLLILAKLLRYLRRQRISRSWFGEAYSRTHYLTSIAVVTSAVLALLFLPFEANLRSWWFPLTAVPYFALYGRDLVQAGYPGTDLFRVYTLNLMLLPINLGGVFKSLQQAWRGQKTPFDRTPKASGRVSAPATYVLAHYGLILGLLAFTAWDLIGGRWFHAAFDAASALCFVYALVVFMGPRVSLEDALRPLRAQVPTAARG
jgi:cellulose synthase/poly-beta-1,6-N-acetylglucosamine synthase-like glycosyltransferase